MLLIHYQIDFTTTALRRLYWLLKYLHFLKNDIGTIDVIVPTRYFEWMSLSFRIVSRKYWKALLVILFYKFTNNFSVFHNNRLTVKYRVFFMEKICVFLPCGIKKSTYVLFCFYVVSINYSCFMRFLDKYVSFTSVPKCIPDNLKRNFFYERSTMLFQMLDNFTVYIAWLICCKPRICLLLCFKVLRKFYSKSSCL
jgi:hypothetical protein